MNTRVLRRACRAEWTKLRTEPGAWWLLLGVVAVTVAVGAAASGTARTVADPARTALAGVTVGQAVVAVLAVLGVGGEYSTGMIQLSLVAVPARATVLAAKAAVLSALVAVSGGVAVLGSLLAGHLLLPGAPALTDGSSLRAAVGSVLYLVLVALLALGVAFAIRDGGAASGAVLALLYLFPLLAHVVTDPWLQRQLARLGPMPAGLAVQATTDLRHLPIGPWPGLGVLALWAAAALAVGEALLRRRDA
ncbi:ABC transporter permease [Streptacidiphilus jiangxiensis]|uniref:ABC-2 family transporter protein n=1 Tax=Streptacidiphilus jiangxiensis TaxID=235985 RepID=A0A1H7U7Q6_STRJI|nr:ABC transporter permease [Streptacidiphilus jiangxiensis]SEL93041.1 ABC-2 family transporter protein [Streptacidiphilus jiangxiensis]